MELLRHLSLENRYLRHGIFWLAWVTGFTFVKSFGSGLETYAAWLVYYLATLPIFMLHTYLVVYWAAGKLLQGVRIMLFVVVFVILMYLFSLLEMILTNTWLARLFPDVFPGIPEYRDPLNVMISGIGNLYIILVFAAAKMVRSWYISDQKGRQMVKNQLFIERADANAGILPGMLLYSVRSIAQMGKERPSEVAGAIAMLSELLNSVMQAYKCKVLRPDEELKNVRNLLKLYAVLMNRSVPALKIEQCNMAVASLPSFIIFSPLEIVTRKFRWMPDDAVEVCIQSDKSTTISWRSGSAMVTGPEPGELTSELDQLYPGRYLVHIDKGPHSMTVRITENQEWGEQRLSLTFQDDRAAS